MIIDSTVVEFLNKYNIKNKNVIVAFSTGPDSCALALALGEAKNLFNLNITLAYFNHGWRKEAKDEEEFTKEFAFKNGFNFLIDSAVGEYKKSEQQARELRYKFLEDCSKKNNSDTVFLAHNKNDNVETLVYRLIKGTSISGLKSIPEKRDIFYRPFLNIEKKEILKYLSEKNQNYLIDSSNNDIKYRRNFIRKEIFPLFSKINPNYIENIDNLIQNVQFSRKIIDDKIANIEKKIIRKNIINRKEYIALDMSYRLEVLNNYLKNYLKNQTYKNVLKYDNFILENENSKTSLNKDCFLYSRTGKIFIQKKLLKNNAEVLIDGEGKYFFEDIALTIEKMEDIPSVFPLANDSKCYLSLNFPLVLRHRKQGDIFCPFGLKSGKMKLKKYLINQKISQEKKDKLILLANKDDVCLILNVCLSEKYKIKKSSSCFKLSWEKISSDN